MRTFLCIAFGCVLIYLCQGATVTGTVQVNVAYVESKPITKPATGKTLIQTNADEYAQQILAKATAVSGKIPKIIVLPEYGLTGMNVDKTLAVEINSDNCTKDSPDLKHLYDIAKKAEILLVANLLEKDGDDLYSTTIVMDGIKPTEKLLAKYRKNHLKDEERKKNLKSSGDLGFFEYDGYGKLGILSGDDILYEKPVKELKEKGVKTFIYTSSQKVVIPFRNTVSWYSGFAKGHGVNLVVSNLNDLQNHISGSGIYTPCGPIKSYIAADKTFVDIETLDVEPKTDCASAVLKSTKIPRSFTAGASPTDLAIHNITFLQMLQTELINANSTPDHGVCDFDFCCYFTISSQNWNGENYRLVANWGWGDQGNICGMMICEDDKNVKNCGTLTKTPKTVFDTVTISTSDYRTTFMPYILYSDLTTSTDWKSLTFYNETDPKGTTFTMKSVKPIIAIGLVSATKSAASSLGVAMNVLVISVFLKYLF